jgi:hypothetical protein
MVLGNRNPREIHCDLLAQLEAWAAPRLHDYNVASRSLISQPTLAFVAAPTYHRIVDSIELALA